MDWSTIGRLIGGVAPVLGTVLGGPLGAVGGALLSTALGAASATPDAVMQIIQQGGQTVTAAIQSAEATAQAKWGYLTAGVQSDAEQSKSINATMQAEYAAGVSWWHWRHWIGYLTLLWFAVPLPPLAYAMWTANEKQFNTLVAGLVALLAFYTILSGLCGYVAGDTTRRTTAALAGTPVTTAFSTLFNAFKRK